MESSNLFFNLLQQDSTLATNYFDNISLGKKTEIKYGFVEDSISLTFIITGKAEKKDLNMSEKIKILFQTNSDLEALNQYLPEIKDISKFYYAPYLKINEKPEMYAFQIQINHNIN